jgi:IclR family KDG regulon transcriptional repressor
MAGHYKNRSVSRAFHVLECVSDTAEPMGLAEIARRAGLDRSTTLRFLAVLNELGYIHRHPTEGTYRLGHRIGRFAEQARSSDVLCDVARPIVTDLAGKCGESTYVGVMEGTYMYYRQRIDPPTAAQKRTTIDMPFDPVCMIPGRLLLAYREPAEVEKVYDEGRTLRPSWRNVPTLATLGRTLSHIRGDGYYTGELECSPGMYCIAVPVFDRRNETVGCVTVTGPGARLRRPKVSTYVQHLQGAARSISAQLQ